LEIKLEVENEDAGTTLTAIPLLQTFIPELDPANRDDLLPAYLAFRMGKLAGTSSF